MLGDASFSSTTWPYYFLLQRGLTSYLRITRRPLGYLRCHGRWAPFLYCRQSGALFSFYLARLFRQDRAFFLPGPANDRFPVVDVHINPSLPSSVLPAPPVSSLCLDTNKETNLRATGSQDCWSLHLCHTNHMWGGEPSKLLVAKGY